MARCRNPEAASVTALHSSALSFQLSQQRWKVTSHAVKGYISAMTEMGLPCSEQHELWHTAINPPGHQSATTSAATTPGQK